MNDGLDVIGFAPLLRMPGGLLCRNFGIRQAFKNELIFETISAHFWCACFVQLGAALFQGFLGTGILSICPTLV